MPRDVDVVPHTHWDREWYAGFQTFRLRLVDLLDELLPRLETDASFTHFLLDGQMAVVDDYLEVRPGEESRLRRLAASGRLSMGPWYVLMDEFLVSGETIVRNLQLGLHRAEELGGPMPVGYLPDMFGHIAQMPQLLRQAGLSHAVVWRGVPAALGSSAFWWVSPDGSRVRAEYLPDGYGNGATLPPDGAGLVDAVQRFETRHADRLLGSVLWLYGTDHQVPEARVGRVLEEANAVQHDLRFRIRPLAEHLRDAPVDDLPTWHGELRSGARANLLMGVASNRVDVKQAAAAAEKSLERLAEPLSALHLPAGRWPHRLVELAWLELIRNSAHDSVCACSDDEVVDAVLHRYAAARQIADGLTERALAALASQLAEAGPVAVNPSARERSGPVQLLLDGHDPVPGTQVLGLVGDSTLEGCDRSELAVLVPEVFDAMPEVIAGTLHPGDDGVLTVELRSAPATPAAPGGGHRDRRVCDELAAAAEADPTGAARLVLRLPDRQHVLAWAERVPGFGWRRLEPSALPVPTVGVRELPATAASRPGAVRLDTPLVRVDVDPADGTFAIDGVAGFGRLVDDGDVGDTYNWCPPGEDTVVERPDHVEVQVVERGPLRARVAVRRTYTWPEEAVDGTRTGTRRVPVEMVVEVRAGSPLVRLTIELDNTARDHRLRLWSPLPRPATVSQAECAFAVVERGLDAEGGTGEPALPTYPSRRFVQAGGLTVVHEGLHEYELVDRRDDGAHALALTLLRCVGVISRGPMATRPLPAGPMTPTPGAQLPGRRRFRLALRLGGTDPYADVDDAHVDLRVVDAPGGGEAPPRGQALEVHGAEVSAVRREAGLVELRVFNPGDETVEVAIPGRRGWLVDLRGDVTDGVADRFPLRPRGIATVRLAEPGA